MLIGLAGYARSGKDTFASALVEHLGFTRVAFADPLKNVLYDLNPPVHLVTGTGLLDFTRTSVKEVVDHFGWDTLKADTREGRPFLQDLGVAVRQHVESNAWVTAAMRTAEEAGGNVVFSDVRFPNEADAIRDAGGTLIRIERPGTEAANEHVSEHALADYRFDITVRNDGTEESLRSTAVTIVKAHLKVGW